MEKKQLIQIFKIENIAIAVATRFMGYKFLDNNY